MATGTPYRRKKRLSSLGYRLAFMIRFRSEVDVLASQHSSKLPGDDQIAGDGHRNAVPQEEEVVEPRVQVGLHDQIPIGGRCAGLAAFVEAPRRRPDSWRWPPERRTAGRRGCRASGTGWPS